MLVRFFSAVGIGLLVGGVVYEGALAAHNLFFPDHDLLQSIINGATFSAGKAFVLTCYWTMGVTASALMSTGLARTRWAGLLSAACWLLPLCLLLGLSQQSFIRVALPFSIVILAWLISLRFGTLNPEDAQP